jgi:hypothetical protein
MARKGADGMPLPFSLKYVKKSTGEIISIEQAVLTSSNHLDYFNVMILPSREIRKLILPLIIEFNGTPTFI